VASKCAPIRSHSSSSRWCDNHDSFSTHEHSSCPADPKASPCGSPGLRDFLPWAISLTATSPSPTYSRPSPAASLIRYSPVAVGGGKVVVRSSGIQVDQACPHPPSSTGLPVSVPAGGVPGAWCGSSVLHTPPRNRRPISTSRRLFPDDLRNP